ncbi:YraN family protein, partial [Leptospira perolatii]
CVCLVLPMFPVYSVTHVSGSYQGRGSLLQSTFLFLNVPSSFSYLNICMNTKYRKIKGKTGEDFAADWLVSQGHKILERNFRIRKGEIDIISVEGKTIHFIEVKHWTKGKEFLPLQSLTQAKILRMRLAAEVYLTRNVLFLSYLVSFDLAHLNEKRELNFYLGLF